MPPAVIIAGAGLGVAAAGTFMSIKAQKKQAKYMKAANKAQRQQDTLRAARERKEAIRAARMSTGTVLQASVNQGSIDTSASLGGLGSIESQLKSNLSFLDQFNALSDQAGNLIGKANQQGANAAVWGQVAQVGEKIAQNSSGLSAGVFGK